MQFPRKDLLRTLCKFRRARQIKLWGALMKKEEQMKAAWTLLQEVELDPRTYTARGRPQLRQTARISCSLPGDVVRRLDNLGNARSHHVERAVKLYLLLMEHFLSGPTLADHRK